MKLGITACLAGSAAALLFSGCTTDEVAAVDSYRSPYYTSTAVSTEPVFVERRVVTVDNVAREVPIYRTGDDYFYTWGGRRFTIADYPAMQRTASTTVIRSRPAAGRYQRVDRTVITDDNLADREVVDETMGMK